jgi:ParB/RepB/Spo0J family partition protein
MSLIGISSIEIDKNCRIIPGVEDLSKAEPKDLPKDVLAKIEELSKSIDENGLVQPIAVKELSDGKYRLIAGWRRIMAHKLLGKTMIDAKVHKGKKEDESTMQLVENVHREDLSPLEIAHHLEKIREQKKFTTQDALSKFIGWSPAKVSQHLALLKADSEVQKAVANKEIGIGSARAVASLPKGEQKKAIVAARKEAAKSGDKDKKTGKVKVKVKGVRRQARKSKAKADRKAGKIRPVAERSKEQGQFMVQSFIDEEFGQKKPSKKEVALVEKFWNFLMKKNRLVIR